MELRRIKEELDKGYVKANLQQICQFLSNMAKKHEAVLLSVGLSKNYLKSLQRDFKVNARKQVFIDLIAPLFQNADALQVVLGAMGPKGIINLFDDLMMGKTVFLNEVRPNYGINILSEMRQANKYSGSTYEPVWSTYAIFFVDIHQRYAWWVRNEVEMKRHIGLSMSTEQQSLFRACMPRPKKAIVKPLSDTEAVKYGERFSAEQAILQELPQLVEAWDSGMIKVTKSGGVSEASVKKIQKSFSVLEFYNKAEADKAHKMLFPIRSRLLLQLIEATKERHANPVELLRSILKTYQTGNLDKALAIYKFRELEVLIPNLKGWNKAYERLVHHRAQHIEPTASSYFKLLKELHQGENWIPIEQASTSLTYDKEHPVPVAPNMIDRIVYFWEEGDYGKEREYVDKNTRYEELVQKPLFTGCIMLLGALGLAELRIQTPKPLKLLGTQIPYSTFIKAYRLTKLGQYLLGMIKEYDASELIPEQATVTLSTDDLMVLLDKEDEAKATVLRFYAQEISPRRFLVNSEAFLKNCKSKAELQERISNFRRLADEGTLPANWRNFFNDLKRRVLKMDPLEEVMIYQLPLDNKPLQRIVATDPDFRKIVQKAEGMKVLVEKKDLRKFKSLLKAHGYLWE